MRCTHELRCVMEFERDWAFLLAGGSYKSLYPFRWR